MNDSKFFARVTQSDIRVVFDRLSPSGKVLARRYRNLLAYLTDVILRQMKSGNTAADLSAPRIAWVEGLIASAAGNGMPEDTVFPNYIGREQIYGAELAVEYASLLNNLTGFLGTQPDQKPVQKLKLVVNNT